MAEEKDPIDTPVEVVVSKASRFSREFIATVISLVTTAFGVVVALAWNTAVQRVFEEYIGTEGSRVAAQFVYALLVTLIGVVIIIYLGRLATRIGAQPVEFKFPAPPKKTG